MFGSLGFTEIAFVMVLALLLFGPKRLPEIGKTIGKGLAEFRRASNDLKRTLEREVAFDEIEQRGGTGGTLATGGTLTPLRPSLLDPNAASRPVAPEPAAPVASPVPAENEPAVPVEATEPASAPPIEPSAATAVPSPAGERPE